MAGEGGLSDVELCDRCGEPSAGIDIEVRRRFGEIMCVLSSVRGLFGVLAALPAEQLSLPEDPGRLGEPGMVAKS